MIKSLYSTTLFQPDNIRPTIGQNIGRVTVGENDKIVLAFWDLGGQEGLRKIWEEYYKESDALIFVVDATDKGRIEECKDALGTLPPSPLARVSVSWVLAVCVDGRGDYFASGYGGYSCVDAGE